MKKIIMAFGALAIAGAAPVSAQSTPPTAPDTTMAPPAAAPPSAPDATMAPPATPTPPAPDASMAPTQPGSAAPAQASPDSSAQSSMPAATTGPLPKCTAKVKDRCDQSATSERYALSADQAMKTGGVGDRRSDNAAAVKSTSGGHKVHHRAHKPAAAAAPAPAA